jgi:hypothetical protein
MGLGKFRASGSFEVPGRLILALLIALATLVLSYIFKN